MWKVEVSLEARFDMMVEGGEGVGAVVGGGCGTAGTWSTEARTLTVWRVCVAELETYFDAKTLPRWRIEPWLSSFSSV